MPANKYALLRYRIIDRCISNKFRPYPNKEDLRRACEEELYGSDGDRISLSTIDKDLYAMRNESNLGYYAPIAFSKIEKGYFYEDPDYSIDELPLNVEDLEAIKLAANTLSQFRGIQLFKSSGDAIDKIIDRLSLQPSNDQRVDSYVQFETPSEYRGSHHLKRLFDAIRDKTQVGFEYAKFSGEPSKHYDLHPYLLREYRNRWYVIGNNPSKQAIVVFGLDRIVGEIELSQKRFDRLTEFNSDLYFKHSIGITAIDEAPQSVVLRFEPLTARYVESQPLHESQKVSVLSSGKVDVELYVCLTQELKMQILSYGSNVEIVKPEKLRQEISDELKKSIDKYNAGFKE